MTVLATATALVVLALAAALLEILLLPHRLVLAALGADEC